MHISEMMKWWNENCCVMIIAQVRIEHLSLNEISKRKKSSDRNYGNLMQTDDLYESFLTRKITSSSLID